MHSLQVYHARKLHRFFHTDMWRFDLSIWMHVIARSSISIFIPIFFLDLGYSIAAVLLFYLLVRVVDVPLNFVMAKMILWVGAKKVFILASASIILFFALFSQLEPNQWPLFTILIVILAIYDSAYWVSHLYLFEKVSHKTEKISEETGFLYIAKNLGSILGPIIGGVVLVFANSKSLMALSILIFILSTIPLFKMKLAHDKPHRHKERVLSPKEFFSKKNEKRNYLSVALYAFHRVGEGVIWPIFIYISFSTIESVAFVPIIISLSSVLFSYLAGKLARRGRERIIAFAAATIALIWIVRLLSSNGVVYYSSIFVVSALALALSVALFSNIFARGKKIGMLNAVTYSNAVSMGAQMLVYLALVLAVSVFKVSFVLAALGLFTLMLVNFLFVLADSRR